MLDVLISCMRQNDAKILERSNVKSNAIVINQCNDESVLDLCTDTSKGNYHVRFINTKERGLSKSRNMAIKNSTAEICLICDDDEVLFDNYAKLILDAFESNPQADIIAFQIQDAGKIYPTKRKRIGYIRALKIASWQIAFRRKKIADNNIYFDEELGSGVTKAGGEENKFLYDCLKSKLKIIYLPLPIGRMIKGESQWFHGFTEEYFFDRGRMTKKLMGKFFALLYGIYFLIRKRPIYKQDISSSKASYYLFKGLIANS